MVVIFYKLLGIFLGRAENPLIALQPVITVAVTYILVTMQEVQNQYVRFCPRNGSSGMGSEQSCSNQALDLDLRTPSKVSMPPPVAQRKFTV